MRKALRGFSLRTIPTGFSLLVALIWVGCSERTVLPSAVTDSPRESEFEVSLSAQVIPLADWENPPGEARPMARWWWPGGSVDTVSLKEQLALIEEAGFGGVEVQPLLLGLGEEDLEADPRLRSVGEPDFNLRVGEASALAQEGGLFFDLTLGSGWPGGLPTESQNAERQLLMATMDLKGPSSYAGPLPPPPDQSYREAVEWVLDVLGPADIDTQVVAVLAGQLGPERDGLPTLVNVREISKDLKAENLNWNVPEGTWRVFVFYENSTSHFVMGGAFPGEEADAKVVDHLSIKGANALLEGYAERAIDGVPQGQIRGVFVDSFELIGELPFTTNFLNAFKAHAGYDLTPYLPLVFRRGGESKYAEMIDFWGQNGGPLYLDADSEKSERIREDYEGTRAHLFKTEFVERFSDWSKSRDLEFRLQAHGGYADYLDVYALADVPESEGLFGGGRFDFLKLASSAARISGRKWASSESFITLRLYGTRLSDDEMYLLAGRAYSAGINRLVFHGVPYPYLRVDGESWFPFSGGFGRILAGPLPMSSEIDADFLAELPDFNQFLARLSVAMSQGESHAEVAWLRADPIYPDEASLQVGRVDPLAGDSPTAASLRGRGLVHDRISRSMLIDAEAQSKKFRVGAKNYQALILDPIEIAEPSLIEKVVEIARAGVPVFALGELPMRAPGLRDAGVRDARVRRATINLEPIVIRSSEAESLEELLSKTLTGSVMEPTPGESLTVSVDRRRTESGDIVLLFNESWSPTEARLRFTRAGLSPTLYNPRTGARNLIQEKVELGEVVSINFQPAEALILTLSDPAK